MKVYSVPRICITRDTKDWYQMMYPEGMIAHLNTKELAVMLSLHRQNIVRNALPEVNKFLSEDIAFEEATKIARKLRRYDMIARSEIESVEDHINTKKVLQNLARHELKCISLCDLAVFFTDRCNLNCPDCSVDANKRGQADLDIEIIKGVISEAAMLGCVTVGLSGGEPVLPENIDTLINLAKHARQEGIAKVVVATNGHFLPEYLVDLEKAGVTRFSISYHSLMDQFTGNKQSAQKAMESIKAVLASKAHLGVNSVVTSTNFEHVMNIVETIMPIIQGVPHAYLRLSPLVGVGRAKDATLLSVDQVMSLVSTYRELEMTYGEQIRLTCYEDIVKGDPMSCDAGSCYACIRVDGSVSPCDLLGGSFTFGNVKDRCFTDIWNDDSWDQYRDFETINAKCDNCDLRLACFGKCRALSYIKFGSITMKDEPDKCPIT